MPCPPRPRTRNGGRRSSPTWLISCCTAAGEVAGCFLANNASALRYVKLYNKASAPSQSDTPLLTIPLPANGAANVLAPAGIDFTTGISCRATTGVADNDTGAPTANDVIVN